MSSSHSPFSDVFAGGGPRPPKPDFAQAPTRVVQDLCALCGAAAVVSAQTVTGGFSVSAAWLLTFDTGRKLFVKGSHPGDMSHGAANLRAECDAYRLLPVLRDVAPDFIGMVCSDAKDDDGWWLGAWQAIDILPDMPRPDACLALLDSMQHSDVPPAAVLPVASAHPYLSQFFTDRHKWRRIAEDAARAAQFDACFADAAAIAQWRAQSLPQLLALQSQLPALSFRIGLMHGDLRIDNIVAADQRLYMIDWANAAEGPLVFDRVMLAASLLAAGRMQAQDAMLAVQAAGEEATAVIAGMAGYFADQMYRPVPAAMPGLRCLQQAMFWALCGMLTASISLPALPAFRS